MSPILERQSKVGKGSRTKRFLFWSGLLVIALVLFLAFQGPARLLNQQTKTAIDRRDLVTADSRIGLLASLGLDNAETEYLRARIARKRGDFEGMSKSLAKARLLRYPSEILKREEGLALAQVGKLDLVERDINLWLHNGLGDAREICEAYSNGLAFNSRFEEAGAILEAWRSDYPDDPEPEFRIGKIHEHLEQYEEAVKSYEISLNKDPKFYPAAYAVGRILLIQRKAEEALGYFQQCKEMPNPLAADVGIASCLKSLGRGDEAREILNKVLATDSKELEASYQQVQEVPSRFTAAAELGKLELDDGNLEEARKWLQQAVDKFPRDLISKYSLAVALRDLGEAEKANELFETIRVAREALARASIVQERINQNEKDLEARLELGKILLDHESERVGLYWIRSIFKYDPNYEPAKKVLAEYEATHAAYAP